MITIVLSLQEDIFDNKISVVLLLRKVLLIAKKLNLKELEKWITSELNGYENIDEVPKYREVQGQVNVWNHYNGIMMPVIFNTEVESELFRNLKVTLRIAEIESLAHKIESEKLYIPFPEDLMLELIRKNHLQSPPVLKVERSTLQGILESVRDQMYKWTLKFLEDRNKVVDSAFTGEEKEFIAESGSISINKIQSLFGYVGNNEGGTERRGD